MAKRETGSKPPTAEYVMGMKQLRESDGDESALRVRIDEMRELAEMRKKVEIPEQYRKVTQEIRTPFAHDTCQRVTAAITQHPPVAHVEPTGEDQEARQSANVAERWTQAAIERMTEAHGEDVIYGSVKALVRDEQSVIKVVHRPDAWGAFPRRQGGEKPEEFEKRVEAFKKRENLPFAWRVVDRKCVYPGEGEFEPVDVIEAGEYPILEMERKYGMVRTSDLRLRNPKNLRLGIPKPEGELQSSFGHVLKVEYWDRDWWHVVIDGEDAPGFPKPNPYGRIPYFRAKLEEPVLMALKWLVPALDALLTMKLNWAYLGAYPIPVLQTAPNQLGPDLPVGEEGQPSNLTWEVGKLFEPPAGKTLTFLSPPPVGQDLNQLVLILRELIDIAGVPSVFRGQGGADQAGYAINQLIAAANLTYKILTSTAQRQLQEAARFLWDIVRYRIRQPVYVLEQPPISPDTGKPKKDAQKAWLCLDPTGKVRGQNVAQVGHLAKLTYSFRPVLPTDEQARAMIAQQLVNSPKPLSSQRHALEKYLQEEDPDSILDEAWVETQLNSEPVNSRTVEEAFRIAGMLPEQQQNPAAQLVGPDGTPLLPVNPYAPGQASSGMPSVRGINEPFIPETPGTPPIGSGGRPAGMFRQPGGVPATNRVGA